MEINEFVKNFASQFENTPLSEFKADTRFRDIEEWDSMLALTIMAMVDEKYKVKITPEEMRKSQTVNELFNIVSAKL